MLVAILCTLPKEIEKDFTTILFGAVSYLSHLFFLVAISRYSETKRGLVFSAFEQLIEQGTGRRSSPRSPELLSGIMQLQFSLSPSELLLTTEHVRKKISRSWWHSRYCTNSSLICLYVHIYIHRYVYINIMCIIYMHRKDIDIQAKSNNLGANV